MKVDNAIILAAGTSSRFAPLSYEKHKALTMVKGDVLIERQIKQLKISGVPDVYIVVGYKAEQFEYLKEKDGVRIIYNKDYLTRNNNASIWVARGVLGNSYICSADNYFLTNPFEPEVEDAYYAAEYSNGITSEWCMTVNEEGYISQVKIGGASAWYMYGHTFWSRQFSERFISVLEKEYNFPETHCKLWEKIFMEHLDILKMKIKKYEPGTIYEFDTLDELRKFDSSYIADTRSSILKHISLKLGITEKDIVNIKNVNGASSEAIGFEFDCPAGRFVYDYESEELKSVGR